MYFKGVRTDIGMEMDHILHYLKQNIESSASICEWNAKEILSLQMAGSYEFYYVSVLDNDFLLIRPCEDMTIQRIKSQMEYIQQKASLDVAILLENSTPYRTKRMLEERIPFISADRQMYLPFMALHIRKQNEKKQEIKIHEKFTAATQLLYLYMLYQQTCVFGAEELAETLEMSAMTVLRGMRELERIGVIRHEIAGQTGRKKLFRCIDKKDYYSLGKNYLQNPVKDSIYVKEIPQSVRAYKGGLYALAEQTMLGQPTHEIYAVDGKQKAKFQDLDVPRLQALEEGLPEVQLMKYNIGLLARMECVDPITLIKSLNENDERIEIAIEEMMEDTEWFKE